jgi:drug/metabolite transporter (DMT)-like permease
MLYGVSFIGAFRWSLFARSEPLFTSLFAALILGETLASSQYAGMLVVIGSLVLYQLHEKKVLSKMKLELEP